MSRGGDGIVPNDPRWKDVETQREFKAGDGLVDKRYRLRSECCSETVKDPQWGGGGEMLVFPQALSKKPANKCDFGIVAENPQIIKPQTIKPQIIRAQTCPGLLGLSGRGETFTQPLKRS